MNKQTPVQLFLSIFLRVAVAILGVVIIIFGIIFLSNVFKKGGKDKDDSAQSSTVDESVLTEVSQRDDLLFSSTEATETATTEGGQDKTEDKTEEEAGATSKDKSILVLNGAEQGGLAGSVCGKLNGLGYDNTTPSDFDGVIARTKIVAQKNGDGKDFMEMFKSPVYEVGIVTEGAPFDTSDYDIVIIIGTNDQTEEVTSDSEDSSDDSGDYSDSSDSDDESGEYSDDSSDYDESDNSDSDESADTDSDDNEE